MYNTLMLCSLISTITYAMLNTLHVGLFSNALDILTLCRALMFARADDPWLNSTTVATFTKVSEWVGGGELSQSGRRANTGTHTHAATSLVLDRNKFFHTGECILP